MPTPQEVINEFIEHVKLHVETKHEAFGGLVVCPFAKRARIEDRLEWHCIPLTPAEVQGDTPLTRIVDAFCKQDHNLVCTVIHPVMGGISLEDLTAVCEAIQVRVGGDFLCFGGHTDDPFTVGTYKRRKTYPNFQIIRKELHDWGVRALAKTAYYKNFTPENLKAVSYPYQLMRFISSVPGPPLHIRE